MFGIGHITKPIEPCSAEMFDAAIDSLVVRDTCSLIKKLVEERNTTADPKRRQWCIDRVSAAKRTLPCITPMAWFKGNKRSIKNAIPSGLNMIDVDHVQDPAELFKLIIENGKLKIENGQPLVLAGFEIALVHITPSTEGLRIIFKQPEGMPISEAQYNMAHELNVSHDIAVHDDARCSFLVPRDYILYRNDDILFADYEAEETTKADDGGGVQRVSEEKPQTTEPKKKDRVFCDNFKGIPYSEIIKAILFGAGYDQTPAEGERNNALFMLARNLRYCCDFDTDQIIHVLPDWGLPEKEVRQTVESAVKTVRKVSMPQQLQVIVDNLYKQYAKPSEQGYDKVWDFVVEPEGIIKDICDMHPRYLRNAAYLTCMSCFATLLTRLRGKGLGGKILKPNFMVCIEAPQATGKSFMKDIYELVTKPIWLHDEEMRKELREVKRRNKKNEGKEDYEEEEFQGDIRLLPTNTSNRILVERMYLAKYQHLMIMAEEIDSVTKAEKTGKWSEKSDIFRLAFDNSRWGMDYANDNSFTETVNLYLNLLFSGTPVSVGRFFNDVENGLVTRFLFCFLPDNLGQRRPEDPETNVDILRSVQSRLQTYYDIMSSEKGEDAGIMIDTTQICEDVDRLYEQPQRIAYLVNQSDPCRGIVYRRYSIYAVLMCMIETWLNDGVYTESIRDRVIGAITYYTEQLIALYGDELNKSLEFAKEKQELAKARSQKLNTLDMVDEQFTTKDYENALMQAGLKATYSGPYLNRLIAGGLIEKLARGIYKKVI